MGFVFWVTAALTVIYTLILVLPSCAKPQSFSATLLQYASFFLTVFLPLTWCLFTVLFLAPQESSLGNPYWGSERWHGSSGNHDFCEQDYVYYKHIVEFHNTWSSLPIIFYGTTGIFYTRKYATLEGRFPCSFIAIGAVGVGSALFHGSLRSWGQILDEVPMMLIIFAFAYCHLESKATPDHYPWLPIALIASCFAFVAAYLFFYFYAFFLIGFSGGVAMLLLYGVSIYGRVSVLTKRIFLMGVISFLAGFLCWIVDDQFCRHVENFNLHIGWHILTSLGGYLFSLCHVTLRAKPLKKSAVLVLPWVSCNEGHLPQYE